MRKKRFICTFLAILMVFTVFLPGMRVTVSASTMPLVAAGANFSLALKSDGTLWGWGDNRMGQIGAGTIDRSNMPVKIMDNVTNIAVLGNTGYALTANGRQWTWGQNVNVILRTPTEVSTPITITWNGHPQRSVGGNHTLEIRGTETFWAWGNNTDGQLGNGIFSDTFTPEANAVQIPILSNVQQSPDGRFQFITEGGGITITRYLGSEQTPVIPSTLANAAVLKIGDNAFANNAAIRSVSIPAGVTSIGRNAFANCAGLNDVTLPNGLLIIGTEAFIGCTQLPRITIPQTVSMVGERAFANCVSLATAMFNHTNALSLITFGNNTATNNVFQGCPANFTIHYPPGAQNFTTPIWMGYPASPDTGGGDSTNFQYITAPNGDVHITRYNGSAASVTIPTTLGGRPVRRIERHAFENNTSLVNLTIPSGITSIGEQAFTGCNNLTRVTIPASVAVIEDRAFSYCTRMTNARFMHTDANALTIFGNQVFMGTAPDFKITYPQNAANFSTPQWRGYPAEPHQLSSDFEYRLESNGITITRYRGNAAVPLIPTAFEEFPGYELRRIDMGAFENNANIVNIFIPNTVTSIGPRAFAGCANLTGVNIPASVTVIGDNAFRDNPRLQYARFEHPTAAQITHFGQSVFTGHAANFVIIYPRESSVFTQPTWQGYQSRVDAASPTDFQFTSANGQTTITRYNGSGAHVDIPSQLGGFPVTKIGDFAFNGNNALIYAAIPPTVTAIGAQAFEYCSNLQRVVIPGSVTSIGYRAFGNCVNLTEVVIPQSVTALESGAFADCSRLAVAKFEHSNANSITSFGSNVFINTAPGFLISHNENATGFTTPQWRGYNVMRNTLVSGDWEYTAENNEVTITKYIGHAHTVFIPPTLNHLPVKKIGDEAFAGSPITSAAIPSGVTHIGARAFSGCTGLTHINIPATVINIADGAFSGCMHLTAAKFEHVNAHTIMHFGADVFAGTPPDFKILYSYDAVGFTTPVWRGYPAEPEPGETPPPPVLPPPLPPTGPQTLILNEWSPPIDGVKPFVLIPVDATTRVGGVSPRVITTFFGSPPPEFANGVAIIRGIHKDGHEVVVTMTAGSTSATIDGITFDIAAYSGSAAPGKVSVFVEDGRFYVPMRFMTNALGYTIDWNPATATATITK